MSGSTTCGIPSQASAFLDALVAARKAEALRKELEKPVSERRNPDEVIAGVMDGWLFTTPTGTQLDPNNLRKYVFYRCLDLAELRRVRFHDLRHSFASLLIQQGESLAYVKDQLGHYQSPPFFFAFLRKPATSLPIISLAVVLCLVA